MKGIGDPRRGRLLGRGRARGDLSHGGHAVGVQARDLDVVPPPLAHAQQDADQDLVLPRHRLPDLGGLPHLGQELSPPLLRANDHVPATLAARAALQGHLHVRQQLSAGIGRIHPLLCRAERGRQRRRRRHRPRRRRRRRRRRAKLAAGRQERDHQKDAQRAQYVGRMAGWKNGRLADWQIGRLAFQPSSLPNFQPSIPPSSH